MNKTTRAIELFNQGKRPKTIARMIGSTPASVQTMIGKHRKALKSVYTPDIPVTAKSEVTKPDYKSIATELFGSLNEQSKIQAFEMVLNRI